MSNSNLSSANQESQLRQSQNQIYNSTTQSKGNRLNQLGQSVRSGINQAQVVAQINPSNFSSLSNRQNPQSQVMSQEYISQTHSS